VFGTASDNDLVTLALTEWLGAKGLKEHASDVIPTDDTPITPLDQPAPSKGAEPYSRRRELLGPPYEDQQVQLRQGPTPFIDVWFATNRALDEHNLADGYFGNSDRYVTDLDHATYGRCRIRILPADPVGLPPTPWWRRWPRRLVARLLGRATGPYDAYLDIVEPRHTYNNPGEFWRDICQALDRRGGRPADRQTLVHLHGFNTTFDGAIKNTAKLARDLTVPRVHVCFSWPSKAGGLLSYPTDEGRIRKSEQVVERFLEQLRAETGDHASNVIAHSMGNRALIRALKEFALPVAYAGHARMDFNQVILAAPDVPVDAFRHQVSYFHWVVTRTTLYISGRDRALKASSMFHGGRPQAGSPPPTVLPPEDHVDTIDVTNVDLSEFGHTAYRDSRPVIADEDSLIRANTPPDDRIGLDPAVDDDGRRYWVMRR
jgi:hypothetical protein